jgi:hypothetical protein
MAAEDSKTLHIVRNPDSLGVSSSRGSISVVRARPDAILYRFEGHMTEEMFEPSMAFANAALVRSNSRRTEAVAHFAAGLVATALPGRRRRCLKPQTRA